MRTVLDTLMCRHRNPKATMTDRDRAIRIAEIVDALDQMAAGHLQATSRAQVPELMAWVLRQWATLPEAERVPVVAAMETVAAQRDRDEEIAPSRPASPAPAGHAVTDSHAPTK